MSDNGRTPALPGLLCSGDLQTLFHRAPRTLRRWVRDGKLSPVRIGGAVFFRERDIRRLIEGDLQAAVDAADGGNAEAS